MLFSQINQRPLKGRNFLFKIEKNSQFVIFIFIFVDYWNKVIDSVVCWKKRNSLFFQNQLHASFILISVLFSKTLAFQKVDYSLCVYA